MSEHLDYLNWVAPYVDKIDSLKAQIAALEAENAALKAQIAAFETQLRIAASDAVNKAAL